VTLPFRCGAVALVGRPNAGKSTLLNQILGTKLAITSAKAQTTRHRIVGIHNTEGVQAILMDTPGIHEAWTELNRQMVDRALSTLSDADVVCWISDLTVMARRVEAGEPVFDAAEEHVAKAVVKAGLPMVFVPNKVDVVPHPLVLPIIAEVSERFNPAACVPLSALTGDGIDRLVKELSSHLPEGPALYPEDTWTQVSERFLVEEIIREKIFHLTEQEIPYASCIEVRKFDESERETKKLVKIYADIIVERGSQKGIVIGKGGEMLKRIGTLARRELQDVLACRVYLDLHVKVERDWTKTVKGLKKVGFRTK
jgi:GTPase